MTERSGWLWLVGTILQAELSPIAAGNCPGQDASSSAASQQQRISLYTLCRSSLQMLAATLHSWAALECSDFPMDAPARSVLPSFSTSPRPSGAFHRDTHPRCPTFGPGLTDGIACDALTTAAALELSTEPSCRIRAVATCAPGASPTLLRSSREVSTRSETPQTHGLKST